MKHADLILVLILVTGGPLWGCDDATSTPSPDPAVEEAASTITASDIALRMSVLADDSMRGRVTPGLELNEAAEYLAAEMASWGLEPAGSDGFIQWYPVAWDTAPAPNVAGVLPGSVPGYATEYVVVSAHFDHLGVMSPDPTGDSIYNGADDNASGTAALLEVAEALASLSQRPARPVLFLAVSGEEEGLVGSTWYAAHSTVPLGQVVADINVDMISRNDAGTVYGIGLTYTDMGERATELAARHSSLGLKVAPDPAPEERYFFRSDQLSFVRHGIPALFFTTGLHADYHTPADEVGKADTDKAARVARLLFYLVHAVAEAQEVPMWTEAGRNALATVLGAPDATESVVVVTRSAVSHDAVSAPARQPGPARWPPRRSRR